MSGSYINRYIADLQRQVSASAANIKRREQTAREEKLADDPAYSQGAAFRYNVDVRGYKLITAESSYTLVGCTAKPDNGYAADVYASVGKAGKKATVVEGLVFKNNRNFDFRI